MQKTYYSKSVGYVTDVSNANNIINSSWSICSYDSEQTWNLSFANNKGLMHSAKEKDFATFDEAYEKVLELEAKEEA